MGKVKQLYIDKDIPQNIYPKNYMANIFDSSTGENLYAYLSKFNCINVGYVADRESGRRKIPGLYRLVGTLCIFYTDTDRINIEQYIGSKESAGKEDEWVLDSNWRTITGTDSIIDGTITLDKLSDEVKELIGANPNLTITNYPDCEDLDQVDICGEEAKNSVYVLKFADKEYKPENFSGLGRKYLRKNIVQVNEDVPAEYKNVLTQEMVGSGHTIYIVQYDYDLQGETITLEDGVCLSFKGGTINNGTVICNNTDIQGVHSLAQCGTATFNGSFAKGLVLFVDDAMKYWNGSSWTSI